MIEPLASWSSADTLRTFHWRGWSQQLRGRQIQKCAEDLERYDELILDTGPDVVVETGTRHGGSAMWFRDRVDTVITVDLASQMTAGMVRNHDKDTWFIAGDSKDPRVLAQIREIVGDRRVMVSLDSDHHANHVWQEIALYGQLVTPGCRLVVEDGCFDMWEGDDARRGGHRIPEEGGPLKAIRLAGLDLDPRWTRDVDTEGLTAVSHSPCGWWERR